MLVRLTGIIGVGAAALMVGADWILVYVPIHPAEYSLAAAAGTIPQWRLIVGDYLGLLALPFVLVGLYHVHLALAPAGPRMALVPVLLLALSYVVGAPFHRTVSIALLASQGVDTEFAAAVERLYLVPLFFVLAACAVTGSALLFGAIWSRRTAYPRWVAWLSPLISALVFQVAARVGSPVLTGALLPAGFNLATLTFLVVSTRVLWNTPSDMAAV